MTEIRDQLMQPLVPPPAAGERVFRLGIVLNGTVSSGAWTAGVLDALMEALDIWQAAKDAGRPVPDHQVRLEVLGGASGGGVCAAILARAATRGFPHARAEGGTVENPFWRVWVEDLDLAAMLGQLDMGNGSPPPASLLDGAAIQQAVANLLAWGRPHGGVTTLARPRAWLANPFHVGVTLTNLRGIPYVVTFAPEGIHNRQSWFTSHADHALFAFPTGPQSGPVRGDERIVSLDLFDPSWTKFGRFARATGAFPVGFPPVRLTRPAADYKWRAFLRPGGKQDGQQQPMETVLLEPAWDLLPAAQRPGDNYTFDAVDGGALNNQPLEMVRAGMAGLGNALERNPSLARAAVLLIDPFLDAPDLSAPTAPPNLLGVAGGVIDSLIKNNRFSTTDLLLATDPDVASRFLLTAGRDDSRGQRHWGGAALTTSGASAFLGFAFRDYRVHDYLLGRRNCREWLRKHFHLPASNPLFGDFPSKAAAQEYRREGDMLPIIPLVDDARLALPAPVWPVKDPATVDFSEAIKNRLAEVFERTGSLDAVPCGGLAATLLARWAAEKGNDAIRQAVAAVNSRF